MSDAIGDRFKRYEKCYEGFLTPRTPVIVRTDGRAFHTFTREMERPFDWLLIRAMGLATAATASDMAGFRLAYTQSDEASFLLDDTENVDTQPWFGNSLQKIVSIAASAFTIAFYDSAQAIGMPRGLILPTFDARAFNVPKEDVPNYFVWRQRDWERNSLAMVAQSHYSPKELHGKKGPAMHEMLFEKGVNWAHLEPQLRNGSYWTRDRQWVSEIRPTYEAIAALIDPPVLEEV